MYHYHYGVHTLQLALIPTTVKETYPEMASNLTSLLESFQNSLLIQADLQQLKLQNPATAQFLALSCLQHKQCLPDKPVDRARVGWS